MQFMIRFHLVLLCFLIDCIQVSCSKIILLNPVLIPTQCGASTTHYLIHNILLVLPYGMPT